MKTFETKARQGDVYIKRINKLPKNLAEVPREHGKVVLAHGEVTGHMHAIADKHVAHFRDEGLLKTFKNEDGTAPRLRAGGTEPFTYLVVKDAPAALKHDEHDTIMIPPGTYEIRRQREYTPAEIRNVAD